MATIHGYKTTYRSTHIQKEKERYLEQRYADSSRRFGVFMDKKKEWTEREATEKRPTKNESKIVSEK